MCIQSRDCQGTQLGGAMLRDALGRALTLAENMGVRSLLVHALHERARAFYEHYGFQASALGPLILMLRPSSARP